MTYERFLWYKAGNQDNHGLDFYIKKTVSPLRYTITHNGIKYLITETEYARIDDIMNLEEYRPTNPMIGGITRKNITYQQLLDIAPIATVQQKKDDTFIFIVLILFVIMILK